MLKLFWGTNFLQDSYVSNRNPKVWKKRYRHEDRRMFESLVRMEPFALIKTSLDDIIDTLETIRGKKERILSYMKAVKVSAQRKDLMLDELDIATSPLKHPKRATYVGYGLGFYFSSIGLT